MKEPMTREKFRELYGTTGDYQRDEDDYQEFLRFEEARDAMIGR